MAVIRSGATTDEWTVDPISKAGRVTLYDSTGREISPQSKSTYMAGATFTPAAAATDVVTIAGSGTKTIRVLSLKFSTTVTTAGNLDIRLIKRSAADTGGTAVTATLVPLDSNNAVATATVQHFTANPTLGTAVGTIVVMRQGVGIVTGSTTVIDTGIDLLLENAMRNDQPVVLRGTAQQLAVNLNGATLLAGQTHAWQMIWTEE